MSFCLGPGLINFLKKKKYFFEKGPLDVVVAKVSLPFFFVVVVYSGISGFEIFVYGICRMMMAMIKIFWKSECVLTLE